MNIQVKNLHKSFGAKVAVDSLNLTIQPGQILGLLGPNGAGKSTSIKMLTGQMLPDSGEVWIDGNKYSSVPKEFRNKIGVMPQEVIIWDDLTVYENLLFSASMQGISGTSARTKADELVESLNLHSEIKTLGKNLSGGFKRRLNLAISIIHAPEVVFLDEPSPGIDPQNRRFLWDFIKKLGASEKHSVILTDHYIEEAEKLCDYVVIIDQGKIIAEGTVSDLKKKYGEGSSIKLEFDETIDANKIKALFKDIHSQFSTASLHGNEISLFSREGIQALQSALQLVEKHNLKTTHIGIQEASLEDVFLLLTGKEIRE